MDAARRKRGKNFVNLRKLMQSFLIKRVKNTFGSQLITDAIKKGFVPPQEEIFNGMKPEDIKPLKDALHEINP